MHGRAVGPLAAVSIAVLALGFPSSARAIVPIEVQFSVQEILEKVCPEDIPEVCPGDHYLLVNIGSNIPGNDYVRHDFPDNVATNRPANYSTTRAVDLNVGLINIDVLLKDRDGIGDDDDLALTATGGLRIVLDPKTGNWAGDVAQNVGFSEGSGAQIRFNVALVGDRDGDGLQDTWETSGVDLDGNGQIDPDENLPAMGAHPDRKDLFVEVDCIVASNAAGVVTHTHCPLAAATGDVVQAFANAPVQNLDGTQGVQLHVDVGTLYGAGPITTVPRTAGGLAAAGSYGNLGGGGSQIAEAGNTIIDFDGATGNPGTSFYTLKAGNFDATRAPVFRYSIFGHQTNARAPVNDCTSGQAEGTPGNDFYVTLGGTDAAGLACWTADGSGFSVGSRAEQAGTFMHELGHAIGLDHGGDDPINDKPNYLSVMNYTWQACGVPASGPGGLPGGCDFSRLGRGSGGLPPLNETTLDECLGIGGNLGFGARDWDGDGTLEGTTCAAPNITNSVADTNNDGACVQQGANNAFDSALGGDDAVNGSFIGDGPNRVCDTTAVPDDPQSVAVGATPAQPAGIQSFDDWQALAYGFRQLGNFANGVFSPMVEPDPQDLRDSREYASSSARPDVKIDVAGPATVLPGQTVTWTIDVSNAGRGPAFTLGFEDRNPDGSVTSASFQRDLFVVGARVSGTASFAVPANACPKDLIRNSGVATYRDITYRDEDAPLYTSTGAFTTAVLDIVPPELTLSLSPTALWPPDHKLATITATVAATDNCDPNPVVRLVSITSSEPDDGLGDGDTRDDVQGDAVGTRDLEFLVRSERAGLGTGRTYTVTYEALDESGNRTSKQATVLVPVNRSP